jgi:hypothetical protein
MHQIHIPAELTLLSREPLTPQLANISSPDASALLACFTAALNASAIPRTQPMIKDLLRTRSETLSAVLESNVSIAALPGSGGPRHQRCVPAGIKLSVRNMVSNLAGGMADLALMLEEIDCDVEVCASARLCTFISACRLHLFCRMNE